AGSVMPSSSPSCSLTSRYISNGGLDPCESDWLSFREYRVECGQTVKLSSPNRCRIIIGYVISYVSFLPWIYRHTKIRKRDPDALLPEARLYWLLFSEYRPGNPLNIERVFQLTHASGTTRNDRSVWLCLDEFGSAACALDSADDILDLYRDSQCKWKPNQLFFY
ncbi:hypothetical protein T310_9122, partial [Rasamsonia emersonii CBS 393.64]